MTRDPNTWYRIRTTPIPEVFIVCPCGAPCRLVDDQKAACECGREYFVTVSIIGREPDQEHLS